MSNLPAISGEFSTFKHVATRKVYQLIIEIPSEAAQTMFATLGTPGGSEQITVGIARIDPKAVAVPIAKPEAPKERRAFTDLPYSQQAAMRCNEPGFWKYCEESSPGACETLAKRGLSQTQIAADLVRSWCRVESRAQIIKGQQSGDNWESLEAAFYAWSRGMR